MDWWEIELKSLSPETRKAYLRHFNKFIAKYDITSEQLYNMHKESLDIEDPRERKQVALMVRDWMKELEKEGYQTGSIRNMIKSISSFFSANELQFSIKRKDRPIVIHNGQRVIRPELIKKLFDSVGAECRLRNRALIIFLKDSGLRVSDVAHLNVGDYMEAQERQTHLGRFKIFQPIKTQKTAQYAYCHIGPEGVDAVEKYLAERKIVEESIPYTDPLFIGRHGGRLSGNALTSQLRRLCGHLGGDSIKISAHSLRKHHKTSLEGAGMPENWVKRLQGKAASVYSRPEQTDDLTNAYIEKYPALMIFGKEELSRLKQEERINELEILLEKQHEEVERLKDDVWKLWTFDWQPYLIEKDPVTGEFVRKKDDK